MKWNPFTSNKKSKDNCCDIQIVEVEEEKACCSENVTCC